MLPWAPDALIDSPDVHRLPGRAIGRAGGSSSGVTRMLTACDEMSLDRTGGAASGTGPIPTVLSAVTRTPRFVVTELRDD